MNDKSIAVWCPHCEKYHYHGWDDELKAGEASHRIAHCRNKESSFLKGGYYIKVKLED